MFWFKVKNFIRFYILAIVTALFFLLFTFLVFWEVYERVEERNKRLFDYRVESVTTAIEKRMQDYIQILKGAQAMYQVSDTISRREWKNYVDVLEVDENYPGILGIGYTAIIRENEVREFERLVREREYPGFKIWPEGDRPVYTSIFFLEPMNHRNLRALGYDMFSDSVRREGMMRARDTEKPALTGMVKLVQETAVGVQNGFLLYLPVYSKQAHGNLTLTERRKNITGFVYSPFRVNDLINGILKSRYQDIEIEIFDGSVANYRTLLYNRDSIFGYQKQKPSLNRLTSLHIAGHDWLVYVEAKPDFGYEINFPWFILGGGFIISTLLFLVMYSVANIRRSTYMNQLITDNASPALLIVDSKGYCTFMNPAAELLSGYSFEEARNKSFHQLIHHSHADGSLYRPDDCPIANALDSQTTLYNHEDVFFRKNEEMFYGSLNTQPIHENGIVVAHLIEIRDISPEKQAELSLKETNRNLRTLNKIGKNLAAELELKKLIQLVTDSCTELSEAEFGAFIYNQVNEKGETYMHSTFSGEKADVFIDMLIPGNTSLFESTIHLDSVTRSEDITIDPQFRNSNLAGQSQGGHFTVKSYLAVPVISRSGKIIGGLFFGHSKTGVFTQTSEDVVKGIAAQAAIAIDNSQLFEALQSKNNELVRINNDLDNFVYTASHDLKAPMLNIEGLVYALQKAIELNIPERINQIIEMINLSVLKFKETIEALTEVSKINKNFDEELEKVEIKEVVKDIKISINDMIEGTGAKIVEDFSCCDLHFSKQNLKSILLNLITNSIKYKMPSRKPLIKISCKKEGGNIVLIVSDNGLGIPENQLSKIFVMFKRYHSHVEGTGIGLYLVKRIAENYGGTVKVESELEKGTKFTVQLPDLSS